LFPKLKKFLRERKFTKDEDTMMMLYTLQMADLKTSKKIVFLYNGIHATTKY